MYFDAYDFGVRFEDGTVAPVFSEDDARCYAESHTQRGVKAEAVCRARYVGEWEARESASSRRESS